MIKDMKQVQGIFFPSIKFKESGGYPKCIQVVEVPILAIYSSRDSPLRLEN